VCDEGQQPGTSAGASAFHRPDGDSQNLGGLGDRIAMHVHKNEGSALLRGELGQSGDELPVQILALSRQGCGLGRFEQQIQALGVVGELSAAGGGLACPVETRVDGDAVQPGGDGGLAAEGVCCPVGGDEGVLHGVGGFFTIAEGAYRHSPEPVTVPADEFTESFGVALNVPGEEFPVIRCVGPLILSGNGGPCGSVARAGATPSMSGAAAHPLAAAVVAHRRTPPVILARRLYRASAPRDQLITWISVIRPR
jgi:hypothetical protein